jgi:hypothetical protein
MSHAEKNDFTTVSQQNSGRSLPMELLDFLLHNKKWWLLPILLVLGFFGLLVIFAGSAAAPFIYTLF